MQNLKEIFIKDPDVEYESWFQLIAEHLINNYLIKTITNKYQIKEVEFYYYSKDHQDETTYGFSKNMNKHINRIKRHKMAQRNQLTWFFHYSGIDIVFGTEDNPGGILIRGLENVETKEKIDGPLVVLLEVLNQGINIENSKPFELSIISKDTPTNFKVESKRRIGIVAGQYYDKAYNFFI